MTQILGWFAAASVAIPAISSAQQPAQSPPVAKAPNQSKVFVDAALFGVADSLAHARSFSVPFLLFGENASMAASYTKPGKATGVPLEIGGGFMVKHWLGAGVAFSRTTYEHTVGLAASIPHPFFFGRTASAAGVNESALSARERALHVFVTAAPIRRNRMELRVAGGPSFFSYSADMVENVLYSHTYGETTPNNAIAIVGSATRDIAGTGVGFHLAGDFTYFVHHLIGVGVGTRYSQGVVALDREPLSQLSQDFRVGSTVVFLGVRLRLDRVWSR